VDALRAWESAAAWNARLAADRARAASNQTPAQRKITATLVERAWASGAEALALTGSTARDRRTAISDLDFHIVGVRPAYDDLPEEIDIVVIDRHGLWRKLREGDDYVQWTLRYGCILFDRTGIFRAALQAMREERIWPDTTRKRTRLPAHVDHARRLFAMGDRDAAHEQIRAALTAAGRAELLDAGIFPLARRELPAQLRAIGMRPVGDALEMVIHAQPHAADLLACVSILEDLVGGRQRDASWINQRHVVSDAHGGWSVVRPGGVRVSSRHRTQREAVGRAREIVERSGGGQVVIHARDGRVRDRDAVT
jgi:hypothetical protein